MGITNNESAEAYKKFTEDMLNRFSFHPADRDVTKQAHEFIRNECLKLATVLGNLPESRERSIALTKLEEVMFWANATIARNV